MGPIQTIAAGWGGAAIMVIALASVVAWQAIPELEPTVVDRRATLRALRYLARAWPALVGAALLLTLLRVVLLT